MKKRILKYVSKVDRLLSNNDEDTDWEDVLKEHLTQISFFQHERLIHLIVTALVAMLLFDSLILLYVHYSIGVLILFILLLILIIPYIKHYYLLENNVQKMYDQYDKILKRIRHYN